MAKIKIFAPGKLMLLGEWSCLDFGNKCIVGSVSAGTEAQCEPLIKNDIQVVLKDFNLAFKGNISNSEVTWNDPLPELGETSARAIECAVKFLTFNSGFLIETSNNIMTVSSSHCEEKLGFGSSASSTVAIVASLFALKGYDIDQKEIRELIYKISAVSHYFSQGKVGSGFDIASSIFGGIIAYSRFHPKILNDNLDNFSQEEYKEFIKSNWHGLSIESLPFPNIFFTVGWSGQSASTSTMIKKFNHWVKDNKEIKDRLFYKMNEVVNKAINAFKARDTLLIIELIKKNRALLKELTKQSGVEIETDILTALAEIACTSQSGGKLSGAGGGDCGIAFAVSEEIIVAIKKRWQEAGILPVNICLTKTGVSLIS